MNRPRLQAGGPSSPSSASKAEPSGARPKATAAAPSREGRPAPTSIAKLPLKPDRPIFYLPGGDRRTGSRRRSTMTEAASTTASRSPESS